MSNLKQLKDLKEGKCLAIVRRRNGNVIDIEAHYNEKLKVAFFIYNTGDTILGYMQ